MRIYKVAHENIVCPKELRRVEIEIGQDVIEEIRNSVAYEDMMCTISITDEKDVIQAVNFWMQEAVFDLLVKKYFDLGDYTLIVED
jgi:hypothetical protein